MRSIRLLGISGSPRKGATDFAVRAALAYAESLGDVEAEFISLRGDQAWLPQPKVLVGS
jgi:multimeric flavodoxin WrbA